MINEIIEYAKSNNIGAGVDSAAFEVKSIPWDISITLKGKLASDPILYEVESSNVIINGKTKKKKTKRTLSVPYTSKNDIAGGKVYHTLYGTLDILLQKNEKESAPVKLEFFKNRLIEISGKCKKYTKHLNAILKLLDDKIEIEKLYKFFIKNNIKLTESVTFVVDGIRLLDENDIRDIWKEIIKSKLESVDPNLNMCLITGKLTQTVRTIEGVKGIRGGLPTGTSLISYDKPSFESYGLDRSNNGAISVESELLLRCGLQSLIDNNSIVMGDNTYLYWLKNKTESSNIMDLLKSGNIIEVKNWLISPMDGNSVNSVIDDNIYYLVSIAPNGGRLAIKDYIMCSLSKVRRNICNWFSDMEYDGCQYYGIENLFRSLKRQGEKYNDYKHYNNMIEAMIRSAILNRPLPKNILAEAIYREIISITTNKDINISRLALINLCLNRRNNIMTKNLNEKSTDLSYLCGRLWAIITKLHKQAMPHVETSPVERMFNSACSHPQHTITAQLCKINQGYYYKQANRICGGMGTNRKKEIDELVSIIGTMGGFPLSSSTEEKAKFIIGYHQQFTKPVN